MRAFADFEKSHDRTVICDFVCPTEETRNQFDADIVLWVNTIERGRFENTNSIFEPPKEVDFVVETRYNDSDIKKLTEEILEKGTV